MKKSFPGYYLLTEDNFSAMWESCIFTLDANVLLNLYRYSPETRDELLGILQDYSSRLWLPHQAALEYHRNRISVIQKLAEVYDAVEKLLKDSQHKIESDLRPLVGRGRHPFVNENLIDKISTIFTDLQGDIVKQSKNHPDLIKEDPILDVITNLFENKVGPPTLSRNLIK
jgi:hypothetical protein